MGWFFIFESYFVWTRVGFVRDNHADTVESGVTTVQTVRKDWVVVCCQLCNSIENIYFYS